MNIIEKIIAFVRELEDKLKALSAELRVYEREQVSSLWQWISNFDVVHYCIAFSIIAFIACLVLLKFNKHRHVNKTSRS